jgi:hypothetical protein
LGEIVKAIFGGGGGGGTVGNMMSPPSAPTTPTAVVPPPDRSDADIQAQAAAQRRRYGIGGGRTATNLTGGLGVPSGTTYSAVANLLGGTA